MLRITRLKCADTQKSCLKSADLVQFDCSYDHFKTMTGLQLTDKRNLSQLPNVLSGCFRYWWQHSPSFIKKKWALFADWYLITNAIEKVAFSVRTALESKLEDIVSTWWTTVTPKINSAEGKQTQAWKPTNSSTNTNTLHTCPKGKASGFHWKTIERLV